MEAGGPTLVYDDGKGAFLPGQLHIKEIAERVEEDFLVIEPGKRIVDDISSNSIVKAE